MTGSVLFFSGHGVQEPDAGGPAEGAGAASGEQPAGEGSLPQEPALAAGAARQQDLRADGAARHPGQAPPEQLESGAATHQHHQPALRGHITRMSAITRLGDLNFFSPHVRASRGICLHAMHSRYTRYILVHVYKPAKFAWIMPSPPLLWNIFVTCKQTL